MLLYFLRDSFSYLLVLAFVGVVFPIWYTHDIWYMYQNAGQEGMTLSAETGLTEQKYNYWSQFSTVHTPNFVEQWISTETFLGVVIVELYFYYILCCTCCCCCSCYCICTGSRAIITIITVIILLTIDWL